MIRRFLARHTHLVIDADVKDVRFLGFAWTRFGFGVFWRSTDEAL